MHPFQDYDRDKGLRELQRELMAEERRQHQLYGAPLSVSGGTSFGGSEVIAKMGAVAGAVGPSATDLSMLTRDCVTALSPQYFANIGQYFRVTAMGVISTTATVPTYQMKLRMHTAYGSPVAGVMMAQNATITPIAAANQYWYLDALGVVRLPGAGGNALVIGKLLNAWAAAATLVATPFVNATPPTAVTEDLSLSQFVDLTMVQGAATAGNTAQCLAYTLESLN